MVAPQGGSSETSQWTRVPWRRVFKMQVPGPEPTRRRSDSVSLGWDPGTCIFNKRSWRFGCIWLGIILQKECRLAPLYHWVPVAYVPSGQHPEQAESVPMANRGADQPVNTKVCSSWASTAQGAGRLETHLLDQTPCKPRSIGPHCFLYQVGGGEDPASQTPAFHTSPSRCLV